jgi:guanosine-3',5'-bis(diphosphate) 3'-pyrophosphohydrolase
MRAASELLRDHVALVTRAADFAARRHSGQVRKGTAREPYLNHLAEVAALLAETADEPDAWLVAAGWLHDTVEDTATEREELVELFGETIAAIVAEVTDDKSLPRAERKRLQIETATQKSPRARALKIADKISNIRSLIVSPPDDWERDRLIDYVDWAEKVVAGCRCVNPRLDQLFDQTVTEARKAL